MFTLEEVLSKRNQREALEFLISKGNSCGADGMFMADLKEYWNLNHTIIIDKILSGEYEPGLAKGTEIINKKGKRRVIYNLTAVDSLICRMFSQKLRRYFEPEFVSSSFAYQENKGVVSAVALAQKFIAEGNKLVVEIDLKDYFEQISHDKMVDILSTKIRDKRVIDIIHKYLSCKVLVNDKVVTRECGILQGNSMSPVLSNLYLNEFDKRLDVKGLSWLRFADNIYVYCKDKDEAANLYNEIRGLLENEYKLKINSSKSGIYEATERWVLGYEFVRVSGKIVAQKHAYTPKNQYGNWHRSGLEHIGREYHIVQDGILTKDDYSLLFENEEEKHELPVKGVEHITMYADVTITPAARKLISENGIRLCFVDKYGNLMGNYIPRKSTQSALMLLKQVQFYESENRYKQALAFEKSSLHNMRAILRYYNKKKKKIFSFQIEQLTQCIEELNKKKNVNDMLLVEARAKQLYYHSFCLIIRQDDFMFVKRTKRPPKDELNALISFGNTLLYNYILQCIYKTSLDPRIGVVHATTHRNTSLNLDFADVFKPIIVDRIIFSLINLMEIQKERHFELRENGAVFLNEEGKRLFIKAFQQKLDDCVSIDKKKISYRQLMYTEVQKFQQCIENASVYKPYKYY